MKKLILILTLMGCQDDYMTLERRIIDSDSKVPLYFYAEPEQAGDFANTWYPEFTYYVYHLEEGAYDAYFHAYLVTDDSVSWSGTKEIFLESGKKILGHYSGINTAFLPGEYLEKTTPMAYVSVSYE